MGQTAIREVPIEVYSTGCLSEIELESATERIRIEAIQSQLVQVADIALYEEVDLPVRSTRPTTKPSPGT